MLNLQTFLADDTTVGNWGGQEDLAAEQVNRIIQALYDAASDDIEEEELADVLGRVWDQWGGEEEKGFLNLLRK
jgi:hypothetical protein